ncbi:Mut7-C RNAse domain-containing protein [Candidatus Aerophobetes bacterium]|nr:Mut7-C RNAse domain-containing protein [Candidatus Aerophobetes bacterium]
MEVKFFADSMLGKLARWLRLMGFDTLYYPSISDEELIRESQKDGRIVLTKDSELVRENKNKVNFLYIVPSDPYEQIKIVIKKFKLDPWKGLFSRCVHCNEPIKKIENILEIKDEVPSYAYQNSSSFYRCPACGRIYWEGSHHKKIRAKIEELMQE